MNIIEIINKKRIGYELSCEELEYAFNSYLNESVTDYQMSALLMAICINDMSFDEIISLTDIFIKSGDTINLDKYGICVDKHSTGGVGDKLTLIVGPLVAACNVKMVKMSGRALGHTGGTIDKLESIEGFRTSLTESEVCENVKKIGFVLTGQTGNLTPLDKKIYALRDVTGTVESLPLIASSIMSKKMASGSKKILIDIKVGKGALIKNVEQAKKLASIMIKIGDEYNREVKCLLTKMDVPLGNNIGNGLEIEEVIDILKNNKPGQLTSLALNMASILVSMGKNIDIEDAYNEVTDVFEYKEAYIKFQEFIINQHGNIKEIAKESKKQEIISTKEGYITSFDAYKFGELSMNLGAGRLSKGDKINYGAGVVLNKNISDYITIGETICTLYGNYDKVNDDINTYFEVSLKEPVQEDIIIELVE